MVFLFSALKHLGLFCMLLISSARRHLEEHGVVSYGEVTRHTLGRGGQRLVDALLLISQIGGPLPQLRRGACTRPMLACLPTILAFRCTMA